MIEKLGSQDRIVGISRCEQNPELWPSNSDHASSAVEANHKNPRRKAPHLSFVRDKQNRLFAHGTRRVGGAFHSTVARRASR